MAVRTKTGAAAAKTAETEVTKKTKPKAKTYTKEQILRSDVYRYRRDLVGRSWRTGRATR